MNVSSYLWAVQLLYFHIIARNKIRRNYYYYKSYYQDKKKSKQIELSIHKIIHYNKTQYIYTRVCNMCTGVMYIVWLKIFMGHFLVKIYIQNLDLYNFTILISPVKGL